MEAAQYAFMHKYFYLGAQLNAAVNFLHVHAGQVSPVTLDIGANDVMGDVNTSKCTVVRTLKLTFHTSIQI